MNFSGELVAFVASTDLEASRLFYRDVLGLDLTSTSPYADVYDVDGTTLRVSLVNEKAKAVYTVLGWDVTDLDAAVERLRSAGVAFNDYQEFGLDDHSAWTAPDGTRVAWFDDPDGNVLSLAQHPVQHP
jgi:catechol 2,3-dioxygenase-like lactoylglutathione lyase family enzyme